MTTMLDKKHFPVMLFLGFFLLYLYINFHNVRSDSYDAYPFGADVPRYTAIFKYDKINSGKIATRHPVPVYISIFYKRAFPSLENVIGKDLYVKVPYAFFGALGVLVGFYLSKQILEDPFHVLAFTLIYGFSGSILYFSSVPESYIITAFFSALYIYTFLKYKDRISWKSILILTLWYILSVLSEVLTAFLLVIPAVYFARDFINNKRVRLSLLTFLITSIFLAYIFLNITMHAISGDTLFSYYLAFKGDQSISLLDILNELGEVVLNFFFFSVGYPSYAVTHPLAWEPTYIGFFRPTLWEYFKIKTATGFIILYSILLTLYIKQAKTKNLLTFSLLAYIVLRAIAILFFNPWESYLYVAPTVLPLLVILIGQFKDYSGKMTRYFLCLFLLALIVNNLMFFIV